MSFHIDPTVDVTVAQRAVIEMYGLQVTDEFGHIVVVDPMVTKSFGRASGRRQTGTVNSVHDGRVHGPAEELGDMLAEIVDVHELAKRHEVEAEAIVLPAPKRTKVKGNVPETDAPSKAKAAGKRKIAKSIVTQLSAAEEVAVAAAEIIINTKVPGKAPGVIGALLILLADGNKRTRPELYDALVAQFPNRASETGGMRVTIGVQLVALVKKGHKIVSCASDRGKLYYIG